ncbi:MAG: DUF3375 domain-containing protein [Actinobacteria bacterium]|nr:MAG: DUF3375 domain-containing protein [Actinomycetota bacterium]
MDHEAIEMLRQRHPAWRLLRAANASLILSFLGDYFVQGNRGACAASEVAAALDEHLYALNAVAIAQSGEARFPKAPREYLEDWAADDSGLLRRFYPAGDGDVHYEVTAAFEKAYGWLDAIQERPFVATESRLHTAVELLRQIVQGTQTDPERRLADLRAKRHALDAEIVAVEGGEVPVLAASGVRDRYQQFTSTARELLSDFREVEDNFRRLDRSAREKIATWDGAKGDLLADLVGSRSEIASSDQGHSFQAFYEFLLSDARQRELAELLSRIAELDELQVDRRTRGIHHDWSEAAERAQRTVRQISEQLRRFLDDQVWLENRRVIELVREVEAHAIVLRDDPPPVGLDIDEPGIAIALPFDRPLYQRPVVADVDSLIPPNTAEVDDDVLFAQSFIDQTRLIANIQAAMPHGTAALLSDIVALHPIEQGAAEIVGYLALDGDELSVDMDDTESSTLDFVDPANPEVTKIARLPKVTVRRR